MPAPAVACATVHGRPKQQHEVCSTQGPCSPLLTVLARTVPGLVRCCWWLQAELLKRAGLGVAEDSRRGYDHGTFIPLMLMFPQVTGGGAVTVLRSTALLL